MANRIKQTKHWSLRLLVAMVAAGSLISTGLADSLLTHSYLSAQAETPGTLVSLAANPDMVEPASLSDVGSLLGVVVSNQGTYITDNASAGTLVDTGGVASMLVSTLNGDIKVGDRLTASPINGVGAKATTSGRIVGVAQASFTASTSGAAATSVTDSSGAKHRVSVGEIPVLVNVTYYTAASSAAKSSSASQLAQLASSLTGKPTSGVALVIGGLLLLVALVAGGVILYAGVSSSIASVGRNPLARTAVNRYLLKVVVIAFAIILAGAGLAYLILWVL